MTRFGFTRRDALAIGGTLLASAVGGAGKAEESSEHHGVSAFGDLKYPPDFKHLDYVNPDAPKGGHFSQVAPTRIFNQGLLTFNSLNSFILKGDAAQGMEFTFASLMARAEDEPDAMYGLAARAVQISADRLTYRFVMRHGITFHDGTPLTAHDVVFSLQLLKAKGHPIIQHLLHDFVGAQAPDDDAVVVSLASRHARDLPLFISWLPIFSERFYAQHPFEETTLEPPLGSGPYKVARFEPGHFIEYERVKNWWGADLPVARGQNNFDTVRYEYYRDRDAAFEGFTSKGYLFREELVSRVWATRYDFPAIRDGRVKRDVVPDHTADAAQGWYFNTRLEKFKDKRVREAFIDAFDFEWVNASIMYGAYQRTQSYFEKSDMKAVGRPGPDELAILEAFRGKVPEEVFGEPFVPPVSDGSGQDRVLLRKASTLLQDAGYVIKDGKRTTPQGDAFVVEFLVDDPVSMPHHNAFIKNLGILGIEASVRVVDPVQYRKRVDDFDFDIIVQRFGFAGTPGDSLRTFFTSRAAAMRGSQNVGGISDPVIDALVEKVIAADSRPALISACKALDRVIRSGRYWVPHWYKPSHWLAYWDLFGRPQAQPHYGLAIRQTWWSTSPA
ncbi:MAG TPA: extracellular solute-binding protein [Xanthobacteraceae bacterium]|jgi:microcin C transport system substrate-binding protein